MSASARPEAMRSAQWLRRCRESSTAGGSAKSESRCRMTSGWKSGLDSTGMGVVARKARGQVRETDRRDQSETARVDIEAGAGQEYQSARLASALAVVRAWSLRHSEQDAAATVRGYGWPMATSMKTVLCLFGGEAQR